MSDSSPASIKSQIHGNGRLEVLSLSPEPPNQEFKSQVPYYTQAPQLRSPSPTRELQHVTSPSPIDRIPTSPSKAARRTEMTTPLRQHHPTAQSRNQKIAGLDKIQENSAFSGDAKNLKVVEEPVSPHQSIECEPLDTTFANVVDMPSPDVPDTNRSSIVGQPFPLVEWIRRIREETPKQWPALPLKWARSVPKRQKAILETDDVWVPPLPGKPTRDGIVPIDILTKLIDRADAVVGTKPIDGGASVGSVSDKVSQHFEEEQRPPVIQHDSEQAIPKTPSSNDEDSEEGHWSQSPPSARRIALPPDTSPIRPPSRVSDPALPAEVDHPPTLDQPRTNDEGHLARIQPVSSHPRSPFSQKRLPQQIELSNSERSHSHSSADELAQKSHRAHDEVSPISLQPSSALLSARKVKSPTLLTRSKFNVQVKHTPYPFKDMPRSRRQTEMTQEIPESSLVAGTYPEAAIARAHRPSEKIIRRPLSSSPPDRTVDNAPPLHIDRVRTTQSSPPRASVKRKLDLTQEDESSSASVSTILSQDRTNQTTQNDGFATSLQPRRRIHRPRKVLSVGRSLVERRLPPISPDSSVSRTLAFNEQRKIESRLFRKSISTKARNNDAFLPPVSEVPNELISIQRQMSSSPISYVHAVPSAPSNDEDTSATDHSIQSVIDSKSVESQEAIPGHPLAENVGGQQSLFPSFQVAYPHYQGTLKAFNSALQLLRNLRNAPREPHPILWDDFIYRMAHDYKAYLQNCMNQDESAMSYPEYYYSCVEKPECHQAVINRTTFKAPTEHSTDGQSTAQFAPRSVNNDLRDAAEALVADPEAPKVSKPTIPPASGRTILETQAWSAAQTPIEQVETPGHQHHNQMSKWGMSSATGRGTASRKRRSLPWANGGPEQLTLTPATRQAVDITTSTKKLKESVEKTFDSVPENQRSIWLTEVVTEISALDSEQAEPLRETIRELFRLLKSEDQHLLKTRPALDQVLRGMKPKRNREDDSKQAVAKVRLFSDNPDYGLPKDMLKNLSDQTTRDYHNLCTYAVANGLSSYLPKVIEDTIRELRQEHKGEIRLTSSHVKQMDIALREHMKHHSWLESPNNRINATVERWLDRPAGASSPELDAVAIPVHVEEARDVITGTEPDSPSPGRVVAGMTAQIQEVIYPRLPSSSVMSEDDGIQRIGQNASVDVPSMASSDLASEVERPVTLFTLFARDFAKLQAEKGFHGPSGARRKLPINVYNW